jgi:hypothetical protein
MDSISSFYSLSSGSLPSHFRSISPKPEVRVTIETDDDKSLSKCNTRTVYIILAAIFIVSSSVAVTIAVHEIQRVIQEESAAILPVGYVLIYFGKRVFTMNRKSIKLISSQDKDYIFSL